MRFRLLSLCIAIFLQAGCGGGSDGKSANSPNPVASVAVNASADTLAIGEAATLTATATDSTGHVLTGRPITWSSSAPAVATVSAVGIVTAVGEGEAVVTASTDGRSAQQTIRVVWGAVDVDMGTPAPTKSMSGLLHGFGFNRTPQPPYDRFAAIQPKLWRSIPTVVPSATARSAGALYNLVLSDLTGYPLNRWLGRSPPYTDAAAYREHVRQIVRDNRGQVDVWEIWNEPTIREFWDGTEQQFFETYLAAYRVLREELGDSARIAGPSPHSFDQGFLDRFAAFCVASGCEANVLVWHENGGTAPLENVAANARAARQRYIENPANAALRAREIHVNEFAGPHQVHSPVVPLLYMQYLELGNVDAAAPSCWPTASSTSECYDGTLGGLLSRDFQVRSNHWARRLYAQGATTRVASRSSRGTLLALGSALAGTANVVPSRIVAQVLTGIGQVDGAPQSASIVVRIKGVRTLPGFAGATSAVIGLMAVEPSGQAASPGPRSVAGPTPRPISTDGVLTFVIDSAQRETLYQVSVVVP